jgi:hypothetical protein
MGLPMALNIFISRPWALPETFSVQHWAGIPVLICSISYIPINRIYTINISHAKSLCQQLIRPAISQKVLSASNDHFPKEL